MSEWNPPDPNVAWQPLYLAPRDRPIRLFLPQSKYEHKDGRPFNVESGECVGVWDEDQQHFVDRDTRQKVYASQWAELS